MLKVIYPLSAAGVFFLGAFVLIQAQTPPKPSWRASIAASAETMRITLSPECLAAIDAHILARGFDRAAVTDRGTVTIRDAAGRDEVVCR